ncbi:MAG: hypothetical protein J5I93_05745 [Pirellulaceae bacterium]|nr:hypothetical protein [Pirellulaceae bacterium]
MSVTAFFEKLVGLQQQKTQTATTSYRELVAGIATGEEPNPAEVERLLSETGKSVDDLRVWRQLLFPAATIRIPGWCGWGAWG